MQLALSFPPSPLPPPRLLFHLPSPRTRSLALPLFGPDDDALPWQRCSLCALSLYRLRFERTSERASTGRPEREKGKRRPERSRCNASSQGRHAGSTSYNLPAVSSPASPDARAVSASPTQRQPSNHPSGAFLAPASSPTPPSSTDGANGTRSTRPSSCSLPRCCRSECVAAGWSEAGSEGG